METFAGHDGLPLAYQEAGRADGRGVLLLHGLTGNSDLWQPTASALAPRFRVLGLDLRGHGRSGRTDTVEDFTLEKAAADVFAVADQAGENFTTFTCIGHGMGGDIVQLAALEHPARFEAVVLIGTGPRPLDPSSGWSVTRQQIAGVVERDGIEAGWEAYLEAGLLGWDLDEVPQDILDGWHDQFVLTAPAAFVGFARSSAAQENRTEALGALEVPTLVLTGDDDAAFAEHVRELAGTIPGAELHLIPDGGHSPQISHADEVNEVILDFLKRALPRARP